MNYGIIKIKTKYLFESPARKGPFFTKKSNNLKKIMKGLSLRNKNNNITNLEIYEDEVYTTFKYLINSTNEHLKRNIAD